MTSFEEHPGGCTSGSLRWEYTYNHEGARTATKQADGHVTTFTRDALNRITNVNYQDAGTPNVNYEYDLNGWLTKMTDGIGTTDYVYDERGKLRSVSQPQESGNPLLEYAYDLNGARTELEDTDNKDTTYTRDKAGRISSMTDAGGKTTSYLYEHDGLLQRQVNVNGTAAFYYYDNERRLTQVINKKGVNPTDAEISKHIWTYDVSGNRNQLTEWRAQLEPRSVSGPTPNVLPAGRVSGGSGTPATVPTSRVTGGSGTPNWVPLRTPVAPPQSTTNYTYDKLNRLLTAATTEAGLTSTTTFEYDRVGNRTKVIYGSGGNVHTTTYTYDKADRIQGAVSSSPGQEPQETAYEWTPNGNLIVRGNATFVYDRANRLKSISENGVTTEITYSGSGRAVQKTVGTETIKFTHDIARSLPVVIGQTTTTNGVTTTRERYVRGPGGLTHVTNRLGNDDTVEVMHKDAKGNVRSSTGPASGGSTPVINTWRYDEYGKPLGQEGTSRQPFGYTGQQSLTASTLHLRARAYDPGSAVFLQRDRYPGRLSNPATLNRYAYAGGNPVRYSDPSGLDFRISIIAIAISLFGVNYEFEAMVALDTNILNDNAVNIVTIKQSSDPSFTNAVFEISRIKGWTDADTIEQLKNQEIHLVNVGPVGGGPIVDKTTGAITGYARAYGASNNPIPIGYTGPPDTEVTAYERQWQNGDRHGDTPVFGPQAPTIDGPIVGPGSGAGGSPQGGGTDGVNQNSNSPVEEWGEQDAPFNPHVDVE